MNTTHVSAAEQPYQIGDKGGDEFDSMTCTGYYVSDSHPGFGFTQHYVWWHVSEAGPGWFMNSPTGYGILRVPEDLEIKPLFQTDLEIAADEISLEIF